MSDKNKSTLVIRVGKIEIEGDDLSQALGQEIVARFMDKLTDLKNDLAKHGIETTITSFDESADGDASESSK